MKLMTICVATTDEASELRIRLSVGRLGIEEIKEIPRVIEKKRSWICLGCIKNETSGKARFVMGGWYEPAVYVYWDVNMQALYAVEGEFFTGCSG